jgi:succinylarginine dihydrolase
MTRAWEVNFDGLIGPTHNYCALSYGNKASMANWGEPSNPRAAALQGLEKMKRLRDLGAPQGVLPPLDRPFFDPLRQVGFDGSDPEVCAQAAQEAPELLAACWSASSMWAANSATVTPSADSADGKVHFTPANLVSKYHRSLEAAPTAAVLRMIFADPDHFRLHDPLPGTDLFADEGAANHSRLCAEHGGPGLHLFVFGRDGFGQGPSPKVFPARQTRQACEAVCRRHRLSESQVVLAPQHPDAVDAGVFHNDVIAVGDRDLFFYHEHAYDDTPNVVDRLCRQYESLTGRSLRLLEVAARDLPLDLAVSSYLFNSQLIAGAEGRRVLVAPKECEQSPRVRTYLESLLRRPGRPIDAVEFVDVTQSMRNGGGPACLRLRVVLTGEQMRGLHGNVLLTDDLYEKLQRTIQRTYPDAVAFSDLSDRRFLEKCRTATQQIYAVLGLD